MLSGLLSQSSASILQKSRSPERSQESWRLRTAASQGPLLPTLSSNNSHYTMPLLWPVGTCSVMSEQQYPEDDPIPCVSPTLHMGAQADTLPLPSQLTSSPCCQVYGTTSMERKLWSVTCQQCYPTLVIPAKKDIPAPHLSP